MTMPFPPPSARADESPLLVVLPVRNGEPYVHQLVASLIAQDDPGWQLVVLDNYSTDRTRDTVRAFNDSRIELIESDRPLDIYHSWHRGLAVAERFAQSNPLTTFVGHDDWFYPRFAGLAKAMARAHPNATLYQMMLDLVDVQGRPIRPGKPVPERESWLDMAAAMAWNFRDSVGTGYLFRARDYVRVGGMPHLPRILYADHLLFLRLARLGYKHAGTDTGCAYRLHAGSTSGSMSAPKINDQVEAYAGFVDLFVAEFPEIRQSDTGRAALQTWIGRELYLFDAPAVLRTLTPANRERVAGLRRRLEDLGGKARPDHWSYQAKGQLHRTLRHVKLHGKFGLARWRDRLSR
ncbi:glycosyltransferase family 2 protein [Sphingomonas bacterium]|uniref:glycosyltransferase family 2 protein n=1 Tax=Sphingomonas bacterium TaxID=1895847 RepID=UPI00157575CE|nr:glycosyltransferase family A protein [Sphingomonas bacterium]